MDVKCKLRNEINRVYIAIVVVVLMTFTGFYFIDQNIEQQNTLLTNAIVIRTDDVALRLFKDYDLSLTDDIDWSSLKINACRHGKLYACVGVDSKVD